MVSYATYDSSILSNTTNSLLAQLEEHFLDMEKVTGSNPVETTTILYRRMLSIFHQQTAIVRKGPDRQMVEPNVQNCMVL